MLAACGDSPALSIARSMKSSIAPSEKSNITAQQVADIPYASLLAKIGSGPLSTLILGKVEGEYLHWFSADRAVIVTRNGRVIKTAGLPQNLSSSRPLDADPLDSLANLSAPAYPHRRQVDISPGGIYGAILTLRLVPVGTETIEILGQSHNTVVFTEEGEGDGLKWSFRNAYWCDRDTGFIWKSIQNYVPSAPPLEIQVGKPYLG